MLRQRTAMQRSVDPEDVEMSLLPTYPRAGPADTDDSFLGSVQGWIRRLFQTLHRHATTTFERHILEHDEFPQGMQLCKAFSALSRKPHRGSFKSLCRYQGPYYEREFSPKSDHELWCLCLDSLWTEMERNDTASLQVLFLFVRTPDVGRALSFVEKMFSSYSRLQRLASTLQELVLLEAAIQWELSPLWVSEVSNILKHRHRPLEAVTWEPSSLCKEPTLSYGPWKVSKISLSFTYPTENTIQEFITDLHVYVFRPFAKSPRIERKDIIIFKDEQTGSHKVMLISESPETLPTLLEEDKRELDTPQREDALVDIVSATVDHIRREYTAFMEKASEDLSRTATVGRIYPSGSKIHHFLHLDDCRRSVIRTCDENERNISLCLKFIERHVAQAQDDRTGNIKGFAAELKRTRKDLAKLESIIGLARKTTREQLELAQIRRTSVLTVLAGLYIPMSFITSFFGMNIQSLTKNGTITYQRNTTENGEWSNRTITTDNENHSFELVTYWAVSLPLTFGTILFPLIVGALVRWFLRFASGKQTWWRATVALVSLALLETIGIVAAMDVPMMRDYCGSPDYGYAWIFKYFSGPYAFIVESYNYSTVVALSMLCLFALVFFWNFFHAAQRKDWWGMLYWLIQSTLYLLIMFLPHAFLAWQYMLGCRYENLYLFLCYGGGVIYWFLHGLGWWLRPQWYYRWDERRLRPGN